MPESPSPAQRRPGLPRHGGGFSQAQLSPAWLPSQLDKFEKPLARSRSRPSPQPRSKPGEDKVRSAQGEEERLHRRLLYLEAKVLELEQRPATLEQRLSTQHPSLVGARLTEHLDHELPCPGHEVLNPDQELAHPSLPRTSCEGEGEGEAYVPAQDRVDEMVRIAQRAVDLSSNIFESPLLAARHTSMSPPIQYPNLNPRTTSTTNLTPRTTSTTSNVPDYGARVPMFEERWREDNRLHPQREMSSSPSRKFSAPSPRHRSALKRMDRFSPLGHTQRSLQAASAPLETDFHHPSSPPPPSAGTNQLSTDQATQDLNPGLASEHLFSQVDVNGDGVIDRAEFERAVRSGVVLPKSSGSLRPDGYGSLRPDGYGSGGHVASQSDLLAKTDASLRRLDQLHSECSALLSAPILNARYGRKSRN